MRSWASAMVRMLSCAALVLATVAATATPALAHGRGSDATNYLSRITGTADLAGLQWSVLGADEYLSVTNTSDTELLVYGYREEPYLRVGPDGVFENRNSQAYYLNQDRYGNVQVPEGLDAQAEPDWVKRSDEPTWYWHDHRVHFMGLGLAPQVSDPSQQTLVLDWSVPFAYAGADHSISGELLWVPGSPAWPWLLAGLVLSLPALAGLVISSRGDARSATDAVGPALARPAAAVLGVVAVINLFHLADDLFAVPAPAATTVLAALQTFAFIAVGLFGAWRAWRGGDGAFTALGVGSAALLLGQGLLYLPVLGVSQIPSLFPDLLNRLAVGWTIAQILPIGAIAVIGTRRMLPSAETAPAATAEISEEPA